MEKERKRRCSAGESSIFLRVSFFVPECFFFIFSGFFFFYLSLKENKRKMESLRKV